MLILPPFQGEGHGAQLLEAVHRFYCGLPKVQDITGEKGFFCAFLYNNVASYKLQNTNSLSSFIQFDFKHFKSLHPFNWVSMSVVSWRPVGELREAEGLCAVQTLSKLTGLRGRQAAPRLLWRNGQRGSRQAENQQGGASCWLIYFRFDALQIGLTKKILFLTVETCETRVWNPASESDGHEWWGSGKSISLGGEEEAFRTVQGEVLSHQSSTDLWREYKNTEWLRLFRNLSDVRTVVCSV